MEEIVSFLKVSAVPDQKPIVEEENIQEEIGALRFKAKLDWKEDEGKEEGGKRIALLCTGRTLNA